MKTKLKGLVDIDPSLFSGKSVEEVAILIRDGKKKRGRVKRFFSRIGEWLELKLSKSFLLVTYAFVMIISMVALGFVIELATANYFLSAWIIGTSTISSVWWTFKLLMEKTTSMKPTGIVIYSTHLWIDIITVGVSLSIAFSQLFLSGVVGVLLAPFVLGLVLLWKDDREASSGSLSSSEIGEVFSLYFNDFINRQREKLTGPNTEYGKHEASLKALIARVDSSISYWKKRDKAGDVSSAYVARRFLALERVKNKAEKELTAFRADSKSILDKLTALEEQIPLLHSEINDHLQDRLIGEYEDGLDVLAEESHRITMNHISSMREELLLAESAISTLRLKTVPLLDGVELIDEIEDRAEDIVSETSPQLAVVGS